MFDPDYSWPPRRPRSRSWRRRRSSVAVPGRGTEPQCRSARSRRRLSWSAAAGVTNYVIERGGQLRRYVHAGRVGRDDVLRRHGGSRTARPTPTGFGLSDPGRACTTVSRRRERRQAVRNRHPIRRYDLFPDNASSSPRASTSSTTEAPLTGVRLDTLTSGHPGVQINRHASAVGAWRSPAVAVSVQPGDERSPPHATPPSRSRPPWSRSVSRQRAAVQSASEKDPQNGRSSDSRRFSGDDRTELTRARRRLLHGFRSTSRAKHRDAIVSPCSCPRRRDHGHGGFSIEGTAGADRRAVARVINITNGVRR
jgi:hypothetical protein